MTIFDFSENYFPKFDDEVANVLMDLNECLPNSYDFQDIVLPFSHDTRYQPHHPEPQIKVEQLQLEDQEASLHHQSLDEQCLQHQFEQVQPQHPRHQGQLDFNQVLPCNNYSYGQGFLQQQHLHQLPNHQPEHAGTTKTWRSLKLVMNETSPTTRSYIAYQ